MSNFNFEDLNNQIEQEFANISSLKVLEPLRVKYLGRKGILAKLTTQIADLPPEQRPRFGQQINQIKQKVDRRYKELLTTVSIKDSITAQETAKDRITVKNRLSVTRLGHRHLITQLTEEICDIFIRLGFAVVEGPEIETEYNNFTALNIPLEHASRDVFDTFYLDTRYSILDTRRSNEQRESRIKERLLLRSHTSPVQIRAMQANKPPLAVIAPGRVYRPDAVDASHSFMFHQIEGFMVDDNISFADLKGVLESFIKAVFGQAIKMRFRPHFFPFTEPSAEVDISCVICGGKGCSVCGQKGWLEILGSGMIHPNVFKQVGYDYKKYTGFAFGMGVERIAMLKYGINDIRLFFENDLRFLRQF
jgi:phenylalanyl-tRNA synthetase alpha chain